ncbi:MAG: hypothetical protein A2096_12425 [Spirochaetes bacterium GWF1_41_5]|nr:MAG: hypothetical protein A2096_12425 [Spirochaetes bacterium GWF1_41_5]HBE02029.1 acyl carrier protein [Spirochaetia bacterium]
MTELETELKSHLIKALNVEDIEAEKITEKTLLFKELKLDSIDAIEIETVVAKYYGIKIQTAERNATTMSSIGALAAFIEQYRNRDIEIVSKLYKAV